MNLKGNWVPYEAKMIEMWGLEAVKEVKKRGKQTLDVSSIEWLAKEAEYKQKLADLQK